MAAAKRSANRPMLCMPRASSEPQLPQRTANVLWSCTTWAVEYLSCTPRSHKLGPWHQASIDTSRAALKSWDTSMERWAQSKSKRGSKAKPDIAFWGLTYVLDLLDPFTILSNPDPQLKHPARLPPHMQAEAMRISKSMRPAQPQPTWSREATSRSASA